MNANALKLVDLRIGMRTPEVGNWQRFLNERGITDSDGQPLVADEAFGPKTYAATNRWRAHRSLGTIGIVDDVARRVAYAEGFIPFLQARNFTVIHNTMPARAIDVFVIHDMEYPETPTGAEWCAQFFAGASAPQASAHYSIDRDSIVQSVRDRDVAWHAPGANHNGIGIEHAGYARQTREDWLDEYSRAELAISARLVKKLAGRYNVPLVKLTPDDLRNKKRGICGHADVSLAFGKSTHYDPGKNFPWPEYLALCAG